MNNYQYSKVYYASLFYDTNIWSPYIDSMYTIFSIFTMWFQSLYNTKVYHSVNEYLISSRDARLFEVNITCFSNRCAPSNIRSKREIRLRVTKKVLCQK